VPKKSSSEKLLTVPDPRKKTYIDEQGRKYWFAIGYYGRPIKMYGEPWKFRTTVWEVIVKIIFLGLIALGIYSAIFDK
jgi:hypothetical protein